MAQEVCTMPAFADRIRKKVMGRLLLTEFTTSRTSVSFWQGLLKHAMRVCADRLSCTLCRRQCGHLQPCKAKWFSAARRRQRVCCNCQPSHQANSGFADCVAACWVQHGGEGSKAQAPKMVGCPVCRTLSRSCCTDPCVLLVLMLVHQTRPTCVKLLRSSAQAGRAVRPLFGQKSLYAGVGGDGQQQISSTRTCSV